MLGMSLIREKRTPGDLPNAAQEIKGYVLICFHLCSGILGRAQCRLCQDLDRSLINTRVLIDSGFLAFLLPKDGLINIQCL